MKRILNAFLVCGALFFAFGNILLADPTVYGSSGLITVPTAKSLNYKEMNMSLDYIAGGPKKEELYYKFNLGVLKNWEMGVVGGTVPSEGVFVNAKYYLMSDNSRFPLFLAMGFERLASLNKSEVYLIASKIFQGGLSGHFGFKARFHPEEIDPSIMGGVEYFYNNAFSVLADFTGETRVYMLNTGVRFYIIPEISLRLNIINLGNAENRGIFYTFGLVFLKFL